MRGALSAANRWGSKSPLPAAESAGRLSAPKNLLAHEPAEGCGLSFLSGGLRVSACPDGAGEFLRTSKLWLSHYIFPDLPWFLSSSPEKTWSQSSLQPVPAAIPPPAQQRTSDQGGRPDEEVWPRLTRARRPSPPSNLHHCPRILCGGRSCLPTSIHNPKYQVRVRCGYRPGSLGTLQKPVSLGPARFRKRPRRARSADRPHYPCRRPPWRSGPPGGGGGRGGAGCKARDADQSPGMTPRPGARSARPGRGAFPT